MVTITEPADSEGPRMIVQAPGHGLAEGVYVITARFNKQLVWSLNDVKGCRMIYPASDERWYIGGDGSDGQPWLRSQPHNGRPPNSMEYWEERFGDNEWVRVSTVRVLESYSPDSYIHLRFDEASHLNGWFQKLQQNCWFCNETGTMLTDRLGHWIITLKDVVHVASSEPHYNHQPSSGMQWTLLSGGITARKKSLDDNAMTLQRKQTVLEEQAVTFSRMAEEVHQSLKEVVDIREFEYEIRSHKEIERKQVRAAAGAEDALQTAHDALQKAFYGNTTPTSLPGDSQYLIRQRKISCSVSEAAKQAAIAVEQAKIIQKSNPVVSPRTLQQQSSTSVSAIKVCVPGTPVLTGVYHALFNDLSVHMSQRSWQHNEFQIYDNNGFWAIGTQLDISNGVGWIATIESHNYRPPFDTSLRWRKWTGSGWEIDSQISIEIVE